MEEKSVSLWELSKEEACKLEPMQQVLILNSLTGDCRIDWSDAKNFIAKSKHASSYLKYFTFEEPNFKKGEEQ